MGDNTLSLGVVGGKRAKYFGTPEEKEHYGRLKQLFLLLSPDRSSNDLRKDEFQALKKRNRDGTFESVAEWQDVKVKFDKVIQAAREDKLTPGIMENFYRGLFPDAESDFPHQLIRTERKPLQLLPKLLKPSLTEYPYVADPVISFGMARYDCDTVQVSDKKEKVETCAVLARGTALYDLVTQNSTPTTFCWPSVTRADNYFLVQGGVPKYSIDFITTIKLLDCRKRSSWDDFIIRSYD